MPKFIIRISLIFLFGIASSNYASEAGSYLKKRQINSVLGCRVNLSRGDVFHGNFLGLNIITLMDDGTEISSLEKRAKFNMTDYFIELKGSVKEHESNKKFMVLEVEGDIESEPNIEIVVLSKWNPEISFKLKIPIRLDVDYDINLTGNGGQTGKSFGFINYASNKPTSCGRDWKYDKGRGLWIGSWPNDGQPHTADVLISRSMPYCIESQQNTDDSKSSGVGKKGKDGSDGTNALDADVFVSVISLNERKVLKIEVKKSDSDIIFRYLELDKGSFMIDARGGNGGHGGHGAGGYIGGDGGNAGNGGNGGNIKYYFSSDSWLFKDRFYAFNPGGKAGVPGEGGRDYNKGKNGSAGKDGLKGTTQYILLKD